MENLWFFESYTKTRTRTEIRFFCHSLPEQRQQDRDIEFSDFPTRTETAGQRNKLKDRKFGFCYSDALCAKNTVFKAFIKDFPSLARTTF